MADKPKRYLRTYKVELDVKDELIPVIHSACGTLRFIYNLYIAKVQEDYKAAVEKVHPGFFNEKEEILKYNKGKKKEDRKPVPEAPKVKVKLMAPDKFYNWLKNEYIDQNPDKEWINETHNKAIKQTVTEAKGAFDKFFKGQAGYPQFKKKHDKECSYYFVRNGGKQIINYGRHYIEVPGIGRLHFKEKGRIPSRDSSREILSGRITIKNGRYYVSVSVIYTEPHVAKYAIRKGVGKGVDLGVKDLAIVSDGSVFKNINKSKKVKRLEKLQKHQQRNVSRKTLAFKQRQKDVRKLNRIIEHFNENAPNDQKFPPVVTTSANLGKAKRRSAVLHQRIERIRTDHRRKTVHEIVEDNPEWITIEDLNVSGMMKNRHLSKAIAAQQFHAFKTDLAAACKKRGIELRIAERFYASSKICHKCGHKKTDLKLRDREWTCPHCGHHHDRDLNAAENLRDTKHYTVYSFEPDEGSRSKYETIMI